LSQVESRDLALTLGTLAWALVVGKRASAVPMELTELCGDVMIVRLGPGEASDRGATANLGVGRGLLAETLNADPIEESVSVRARTFIEGAMAGT